MRIKKIIVYRDSNFSNSIFEWVDESKPIILFHLKNQSGKTTLYNIIRSILSGEPLDNKKNDDNVAWSWELQIEHNGNDLILKSNFHSFYWEKNHEPMDDNFENYIFAEVFWKGVNDKIIYGWDKTSISSLLRFSCFSDEDFDSKNSKSADLIHQQFDGKWKKILLMYCLWAKTNDGKQWNDIFSYTNKITKDTKEKTALEKDLSSGVWEIIKQWKGWLFHESLDANIYKNQQDKKLMLENLKEIAKKIDILKAKSEYLNLDSVFVDYISSEKEFIEEGIKKLNEEILDIDKKLIDFSINPKDILTYEQKQQKIEKLKSSISHIEWFLENSIQNTDIIENYSDIINGFWDSFNFKVNIDDLKVELNQSSEWVLKWSKFLANLALQIYAAKYSDQNNKIPLLTLWLYDSVFWWSDIDIIVKCFSKIMDLNHDVKSKLQIFIFTNRYNRYDYKSEIDNFVEENEDYIQNYKINTNRYLFNLE